MYVLDTSALIGAWVRTYPPDVLPVLWERLEGLANAGRLLVPEEVLRELEMQDDDLHRWVRDRSETMVVPTNRAIMVESRAVLGDHPGLTKTGTGRGLADPFVIAVAALRSSVVVTEERGGSAVKPRIPFVCGQRSVPCRTLLDVIRTEGWVFRG